MAELARAVRGGRHGLLRRARVPGLPDARAAAEALRGGRAGGDDDAVSSCARSRPTSSSRTSSRRAPALAAELEGVPVATLVPHVYPDLPPGLPPFSIGARRPRTRVGARLWRVADRAVAIGLEQGRMEYNDARARLGLPPLPYVHTGLSRSLTMVATLPQLEYPRAWPSWCRVVGPLLWEPGGPLVVAAGRGRPGRAGRALDVAGPVGLAAARVPGRARGRAGAGDRDRRPGDRPRRPTRSSCPGCPTRARCRAATS